MVLGSWSFAAAAGGEVASNGTGGGPWSDPKTWHAKVVPGPADDVVVQKHDVVVFDRDDDGKTSCRKLLLDPKGVLLFKSGAGKVTCVVADGIESYGVIKLDGTKNAGDRLELRLASDKAERRHIKLNKGAGLLLYGRAGLAAGTTNVILSAPLPAEAKDEKEELPGLVEADGAVMLDWLRAGVNNIKLQVRNLDNTGAKPNERCNIVECNFTGQGRIHCDACDTPVIAKCRFAYAGAKPLPYAALALGDAPLAELKGNAVLGGFVTGINLYRQTDSVLVGNTIEKCTSGIVAGYGLPNLMVKKTALRGCETGLKIEGASGVIEDVTIEGATTGFVHQNSTLQVNDLRVKDLAAKGVALVWESGTLKLLNSNLAADQIKIAPPPTLPPTQPPLAVTAQQYLVVAVKDAPAGALLEVRSNDPKLAADAADPNVRNSPAPLAGGITPRPGTLTPLVVRSWALDVKGKLEPAPEYVLKVLGPAPEGAARPVLKSLTYRPAPGQRTAPDDPAPTLEVSVK